MTHPAFWGVALYFGIYGVVIVGAIVFERSHYRPPVDRTRGAWEPTGERFLDPTTGQLMEVYHNPATGERDYVAVVNTGNDTDSKQA